MIPVFRLGAVPSIDDIIEILRLHGWQWQQGSIWHSVEIRRKGYAYHSGNMEFHVDGVGAPGKHFAVWSNTGGTIVKIPSSTGYRIVVAAPYELIVIDNTICLHRSPYVIDDKRIFVRVSPIIPVQAPEKEGQEK